MKPRSREWQAEIDWANAHYYPSFPGIHVCGADDQRDCPVTVADFPFSSTAEARFVWGALRERFAAREGEPDDLCIDLNDDENHIDDFPMCRQMLDRFTVAITEAGRSLLKAPDHE